MISRRIALATFATLAFVAAPPAFAADKKAFTDIAFDAAVKAGKPVFVEVHAPWCPICTKQAPILAALQADAKFKGLTVFTIDFDSRKDALKKLNVQKQSTLISFKGGKEIGRSTGVTDRDAIEKLLNSTI